jgi:hypothetical protein
MKKIFNFYFSTVAIVSAIVVFGGIIVLIGNKSNSIFNYILNFSALIGVFAVLFVIVKSLIQYFYLKTLVFRKSYNWRNLLTNCSIGIFFTFAARQLDLLWIGIPANVAFGILLLLTGLIGFPQFLKFGKDSITIYELSKREIKYIDLLSFDYENNMIAFETKGLNYELKVFSVDASQIDKIKNIVKDNKVELV